MLLPSSFASGVDDEQDLYDLYGLDLRDLYDLCDLIFCRVFPGGCLSIQAGTRVVVWDPAAGRGNRHRRRPEARVRSI
jgi:hypothetical protein